MDQNLLHENRIHGDTMFPFSIYSVSVNGDHLFKHHWHDELELILVQEGQALFQIETYHFEASAGEGVFVNTCQLHAAYPENGSHCKLYALVFNAKLLNSSSYDTLQNKYIEPLLRKNYAIPSHIKAKAPWEKDFLFHLAALIKLSLEKPFTYELLIKAHLYLMFSLLFINSRLNQEIQIKPTHQIQIERAKQTLEYIQSNYQKKINISELAALLNISEAHFCRFFKQMVRQTPVDYINEYRIHKAAQLLEDSDKKIIAIAMEVGFENFSYFINTFKHYIGLTPSQYRKQQRNKTELASDFTTQIKKVVQK